MEGFGIFMFCLREGDTEALSMKQRIADPRGQQGRVSADPRGQQGQVSG